MLFIPVQYTFSAFLLDQRTKWKWIIDYLRHQYNLLIHATSGGWPLTTWSKSFWLCPPFRTFSSVSLISNRFFLIENPNHSKCSLFSHQHNLIGLSQYPASMCTSRKLTVSLHEIPIETINPRTPFIPQRTPNPMLSGAKLSQIESWIIHLKRKHTKTIRPFPLCLVDIIYWTLRWIKLDRVITKKDFIWFF